MPRDIRSQNRWVLAGIYALGAIDRARHPPRQTPPLIDVVKEAIDAKVDDLARLVAADSTGDQAYQRGIAQLERWRSAWNANR